MLCYGVRLDPSRDAFADAPKSFGWRGRGFDVCSRKALVGRWRGSGVEIWGRRALSPDSASGLGL